MAIDSNTVNIDDYIRLYEEDGLTLDKIKPLNNETYKIFKSSKANIKIVPSCKTYKDPIAFKRISRFVTNNKFFYMIPITTVNETIVGFILRGVTRSDYSTVSRTFSNPSERLPLMFGFNKQFKYLDKTDNIYPIVVCEGCKDCLTLKRFYPFVVAINTSSMGINSAVLLNISNRFILAYDNDQAGQEGMAKDKKKLRSSGALVDTLSLEEGFKDCAEFVRDPKRLEKLSEQLLTKIKFLYKVKQ